MLAFQTALHFSGLTGNLKMLPILQISMECPNVNLKFLRSLKEELAASDVHQNILDIGSCRLHIVSGAFKTGHDVTQWDIVVFLHSIYNLAQNVPARRPDFVSRTGSTVFPLKFCSVRWLENAEGASSAPDLGHIY